MHFFNAEFIDLFKVLNISQFLVVEGKTVETITLWVDVHRAIIGTAEVNIFVFPFRNIGDGLASMINEPLNQMIFILVNIIHKARRERAVETKTHLRKIF